MPLNKTEHRIKDEVIRACSACWVETVDKHVIDLSKYPKMGIVIDDDAFPTLYGVVAYRKLNDDETFETIYVTENEGAANEFYKSLIEQLKNPPRVH